jgi:hypothetical protein
MSDRTCVEGPDPDGPCRACPWLVANHQRRHADGWYTVANRRRLWGGLRDGRSRPVPPLTRDGAMAHAARLVPWPGEVRMPTTFTWDPALVGVGVPRTRK